MLLPALLGPEYQKQYTQAKAQGNPTFAFIDAAELPTLLHSIIESNERFGRLTEHEQVVNQFLSRALQLVQHGETLRDSPDVALSQWRTLYELTVCFRIWSQPVILEGKVDLFLEMAQRFLDWGHLEKAKVYNWGLTHVERDIEYRYNQLPRHLQLTADYDWLNPAFSERELKHRHNRYHNSFRDLVNRSKELNWDLWGLLDDYVHSSTILHFNPVSLDLISITDPEQVARSFQICLQTLLVDYLSLIIALYPRTYSTVAVSSLAEGQLRQAKRA